MTNQGWRRLLPDQGNYQPPARFPIVAYSEFMPPPRLGSKPYGGVNCSLFHDDDPFGWRVTETEELFQLRPGLGHLAQQILHALVKLGHGDPAHGISRTKLKNNPYWPAALAQNAGKLAHERFVVLLPLALARSQDDKGRVRWTLFGSSEQGPARAFWRGFYTAPDCELPADEAVAFFNNLLDTVYGVKASSLADLAAAGLRILPCVETKNGWSEGPLPSWTAGLMLGKSEPLAKVKYLLTFRPWGGLPPAVRKAYLAGTLHLLPFPGSLVFWGAGDYLRLQEQLPCASQIPLLHVVARHGSPFGIRVPQSGWLHEPRPGAPEPHPHLGPYRNTYRRTHRWQRIHRDQDAAQLLAHEDKLAHVLFSTQPDDVGLYGKPMARNAEIWTHEFQLLLDGPRASRADLRRAFAALSEGGSFGYRFQFPPMQVGRHAVYWQRPLAAWWSEKTGRAELLAHAPLGYLTAYDAQRPRLDRPIELWPRLLNRPDYLAAIELWTPAANHNSGGKTGSGAKNRGAGSPLVANPTHREAHAPSATTRQVLTLLQTVEQLDGKPVASDFARRLLSIPHHESLEDWLKLLPTHSPDPARTAEVVGRLQAGLNGGPAATSGKRAVKKQTKERPLTYHRTGRRSFEVAYWNLISHLATGQYVNKDNADCVQDTVTQAHARHADRDLEALGDYILDYYRALVRKADGGPKVLVGDLPFQWETEFNFSWMGGWQRNQKKLTEERDLVVVIPGRDRSRAVIMADHYDTAYMEDIYEKQRGGTGARLSAAGADDNHSATAALMLGAPVFMELSRQGKLACDVWLVHLTGEEFPSDCMGARYLCQRLVEGKLQIRLGPKRFRDLSRTRIQGVYVLDMVAHNNDHEPDVFQMAPGVGNASLWLAYQSHRAAELWNAAASVWNEKPGRRGLARGRRSADGQTIPAPALHPHLNGQVRLPYNPKSTLYNTDGQIFSDAGVPVVLFMENYDINRQGYHDTHDTLENIDLDYGSAVAAIAIESVARAASFEPDW